MLSKTSPLLLHLSGKKEGKKPSPFKSSKEKARLRVCVWMASASPALTERSYLGTVGTKAALLSFTYFLLLWHTDEKNMKQDFFFFLVEVSWKMLFLLRWGKKKNQFLSKPQLSYMLAPGGVGHVRARVIQVGNTAGLALLNKHLLTCSFKESNFDFNKPVAKGFLYVHACFCRDYAISGVSQVCWCSLCASNSIISPVSLELEAMSALHAVPAWTCLVSLFLLL